MAVKEHIYRRELVRYLMVATMLSLFAPATIRGQSSSPETSAEASVLELQQPVEQTGESHKKEVEEKPALWSWMAHAELDANYIWRGLYVGGSSLQAEAEIEALGLFANMWWNIGTTNYPFGVHSLPYRRVYFNPEVDISLGYTYKGLTLMYVHMYFFDRYLDGTPTRFFDFSNRDIYDGGVTTEWQVMYRISDAVPLRLKWCTRTFGRDGYMENGELKRAYSTYIEALYTVSLPEDITLTPCIGLTPWRSLYTGFEKQFAIINVSLALSKEWRLNEHCSLSVGAVAMYNPSQTDFLWNISAGITTF